MYDFKYVLEIMKEELENDYISPEIKYAFKASVVAIEAQIPLKAIETCMTRQACPICKTKVNWNFCSECGQRIKYQ